MIVITPSGTHTEYFLVSANLFLSNLLWPKQLLRISKELFILIIYSTINDQFGSIRYLVCLYKRIVFINDAYNEFCYVLMIVSLSLLHFYFVRILKLISWLDCNVIRSYFVLTFLYKIVLLFFYQKELVWIVWVPVVMSDGQFSLAANLIWLEIPNRSPRISKQGPY